MLKHCCEYLMKLCRCRNEKVNDQKMPSNNAIDVAIAPFMHPTDNDFQIRQMISQNKFSESLLTEIPSYEFDVFKLDSDIGNKVLLCVSKCIFQQCDLFKLIPEKKFLDFIQELTNDYSRSVEYHNDLHAADVLQTLYVIVVGGSLVDSLSLTKLDIVALMVAAACHDYKHGGLNNDYQVKSQSELAIVYNGNY
jgi:hypothetical protein